MKLKVKSKSINYSKDDKYYGNNHWYSKDNETFLLNNKDNKTVLYMIFSANEWIEIPSNMYTIKTDSLFCKNTPIEITLPDNYKELVKAIPTAHIAEYLLLDIACVAGEFLNDEVSSVDAIEYYELYL
jgi:hypothetical protein